MTTTSAAALLGGMIGAVFVFAIIFLVLLIIAYWKIFTKIGYPGWKALIPIYNEYLLFKACWKPLFFWIALGLSVLGGVLVGLDPGETTTYSNAYASVAYNKPGALSIVGELLTFASLVVWEIRWWFIGKSFGHGVPFLIASIFFPNITTLYVGFNSDEYLGNLSENKTPQHGAHQEE